MSELLHTTQEVLQDLEDTRRQLDTLEQLFRGFERVQQTATKEHEELRRDFVREQLAASQLRLFKVNVGTVGQAVVQAWLRAVSDGNVLLLDAEYQALLSAVELGWLTREELPER